MAQQWNVYVNIKPYTPKDLFTYNHRYIISSILQIEIAHGYYVPT